MNMLGICLAILMCLAVVGITVVLIVEYIGLKKMRADNGGLLAPCIVTRQYSAGNLVFIAMPMAVIMICKIKISWDAGAIGLLPMLEMGFTMAIYGMEYIKKQHNVAVLLSFACACIQLLLTDLYERQPVVWRPVVLLGLELLILTAILLWDIGDVLQNITNTFKSIGLILMDIVSVWANLLYISALMTPREPLGTLALALDAGAAAAVFGLFALSMVLMYVIPDCPLWYRETTI